MDAETGDGRPDFSWDIAVYDRLLANLKPDQKTVPFGDVGITPAQLRIFRERLVRLQEAATNGVAPEPEVITPAGTTFKWPSGNVYYRFDASQVTAGTITSGKMQAFRDGIAEWAAFANLHFIEFTGTPPANYITVQQFASAGEGGFSSSVGMAGGEQFVQFGANSWNRGTVCHEVGHAIGLWHEQQRPDRDTYVTINFSNIDPGLQPNFTIVAGGQTFSTAYDFYSVMHYRRADLTNKMGTPNPSAPDPTIDTVDPNAPYVFFLNLMGNIYDRTLSKSDRAGMAAIYGNPSVLPSAVVTNTNDSGSGSLRSAIYYAFDRSTDAVPTPTTVTFHIPTSDPNYNASTGVFTIKPTFLLVALGAGTTIDGSSQTAFTGDTNTSGPEIALDGSQFAAQGLGLFASGIPIHDSNCTIKNLIVNGFNQNGIVLDGTRAALFGTSANGNVITGCYIGTDRTGTVGVANTFPGIEIFGGASNNTIGGLTSALRNIISGNAHYGISLHDAGTSNNLIEGNYIGVNAAGTGALANAAAGIAIFNGAHNNTVGGTTSTARNIISGNKQQGIQILDAGTNGNVIQGNYIGVNVSGSSAIGNGFFDPPNANFVAGIDIYNGAQNNVVGGTVLGSGNVISGNAAYGVGIANSGTNGNIVRGNLIGTNASGTGAIANGNAAPSHLPFPVVFAGVGVFNGAQNNIIGSAGSGNVISGNAAQGVIVADAGTNSNTVSGNLIGLNAFGSSALANAFAGVAVFGGAQNNTVGGLTSNAGNIISGNSVQGVAISNSGTNGNSVIGNLIGVNSGGGTAIPNGNDGVALFGGAQNNTVGGLTSSARNIISGNSGAGVSVGNSGTNGNLVQGNYIGTDANGTTAVGNAGAGVSLYNGTQNTVIGGGAGARNVISGNGARGVGMFDAATTNNAVQGNYIGLSAAGTAAIANNFSGVEIYLGSNNTIGGTTGSTRNFISGNSDRGVLIDGANASSNVVQGNTIGLDVTGTARPNGNTGVEFFTGSHANTIGGTTIGASNQIASNTNDGIRVYDSGTDGTNMMALLGNSIFSNTALGIDLLYGNNGPQHPNNGQAAPILSSAVLGAAGNVNGTDISGTLNSTASTTFRIEFFASPGGTGQGKNFIGATNVTTNGAGSAAFASLHLSAAVPIAPVQVGGSVITATATDPNNNTSQFSSPIAVAATDTDSDGIPDAWMNSNFGHPTGQAADKSRASDDADGDGLTNLQEFLAGNDPKSGGSWLHITAIARSGTDRLVTFASATGKTYRIDYKDDITSATWILLQDQLNATSSSTQITDSGAGNLVHRFYRVALEP